MAMTDKALTSNFLLLLFDNLVCGCILLHKSQNWYGPTTKRYQVASGMSLSAPPSWMTNMKKDNVSLSSGEDTKNKNGSVIPPAPSAHLTAQRIVYEVEVPIEDVKDTPKVEKDKSLKGTEFELPAEENDESHGVKTVENYGQRGRGAIQEQILKRRLGESAINDSVSSAQSSIQVELKPTQPGRLRLLSGITASFEPGTLTARKFCFIHKFHWAVADAHWHSSDSQTLFRISFILVMGSSGAG